MTHSDRKSEVRRVRGRDGEALGEKTSRVEECRITVTVNRGQCNPTKQKSSSSLSHICDFVCVYPHMVLNPQTLLPVAYTVIKVTRIPGQTKRPPRGLGISKIAARMDLFVLAE